MIKQTNATPTLKSLPFTITKTKTFQCVDCGNRYPVTAATKKINNVKPKYCKYCMC